MEKVRGMKAITFDILDECYYLNKEEFIRMSKWLKEQENKLREGWLTLIKK